MNPFFSFDDDEFFGDLLLMGAASGSKAIEATATGNPLTFLTDLARPLKSLLIPFTPQQEGSGDPSPSNIRSILPWNGLTVFGGGKNLLNVDDRLKLAFNSSYSNWSGENGTVTITGNSTGGYITPCKANTKYAYSFNPTYRGYSLSIRVYEFSDYPQRLTDGTRIYNGSSNENLPPITCTTSANAKWLVVGFYAHDISENIILRDMQFEVGQTATAYEPYHPITETDIVFPSPVYGGEHEAVSGKLMNGWKVETLDDVNAWIQGTYISYSNHNFDDRRKGSSWIGLCSAFPIREGVASGTAFARWGGADAGNFIISPNGSGLTLEDVKTLSGQGEIVLAYPLATPTEQTLTGHQITALIGDNTIWSDANGQMTAVYLKKG